MSIGKKAMLVGLSIKVWIARKYDKEISAEVAERHASDASVDAGRFNKNLLPGKAESYEEVLRISRKIRTFYYDQTLPWSKEGHRILTAANYLPFVEGIRKLRKDFDLAVERFVREYPVLREEARVLLNGMFRDEDYPSATEMPDKFDIEIETLPVPEAGDFRVEILEDDAESIRKEIEERMEKEMSAAHRDLVGRLLIAVKKIAERLSDPEGRIRDAIFENLTEIAEIAPRLNIFGDDRINEIAEEMKKLGSIVPDAVRENPVMRAEVALRAKEIENRIAGFL